MQYEIKSDTNRCTIRFRNPRRLRDSWNFVLAAIILAFVGLVARGQVILLVEGALFALVLTYLGLRRMFGTSSLIVEPGAVTLDRRVFGIGMSRKFPKNEVERIGYEPEVNGYKSHEDSALALMVRADVMPVRFAQTTSPEEAETLFGELKQQGSWLGELIRPVGTPMF